MATSLSGSNISESRREYGPPEMKTAPQGAATPNGAGSGPAKAVHDSFGG